MNRHPVYVGMAALTLVVCVASAADAAVLAIGVPLVPTAVAGSE